MSGGSGYDHAIHNAIAQTTYVTGGSGLNRSGKPAVTSNSYQDSGRVDEAVYQYLSNRTPEEMTLPNSAVHSNNHIHSSDKGAKDQE